MEEITLDYEGIVITIPEENIFNNCNYMIIKMCLRMDGISLEEEWYKAYE